FHDAVFVRVVEKAIPGLPPRVTGRLEPERRLERLIVEVAAQRAAAVGRMSFVPNQSIGHHANATKPEQLPPQSQIPSDSLRVGFLIAIQLFLLLEVSLSSFLRGLVLPEVVEHDPPFDQ